MCYLLLAVTPATAKVPITEPGHATSLSGSMENLVDSKRSLSLIDVLTGPASKQFEKLPGFVNRGYMDGATWTRFTYATPVNGSTNWYLRLVPAILDDVRVYVQVGEDPASPASYSEYQLGDHFPMAGRSIRHLDMVVPLPAAVTTHRTVYIRVVTTSTHNLQGWLYTNEELISWSGTYALFSGLTLGILLVIVLINAFSAVIARSALFAWYSLLVLCVFIRQIGVDGILLALWPKGGAHHINDVLVGGGVSMVLSTYSLFAISLFATRNDRPLIRRYLQTNILVGVLTVLSIPFGWYGHLAPIMVTCALLLSFVAPLLALAQARRKEPGSWLLLSGFAVGFVGVIPRCLSALGIAPSTWLTINAYILGALAQAVVMTLALVQRLHLSQQQLLEITRRAEIHASRTGRTRIRTFRME